MPRPILILAALTLAAPLLILYEVSVWLVRIIEKRREAEDAAPNSVDVAKP